MKEDFTKCIWCFSETPSLYVYSFEQIIFPLFEVNYDDSS